MPRTTNITIDEHLDCSINETIESGRYDSTSEITRSTLRLLEEQELRNNALRDVLEDGIHGGTGDLILRKVVRRRKRSLNA